MNNYLTLLSYSVSFNSRRSPDLEDVFVGIVILCVLTIIIWSIVFAIIRNEKTKTEAATNAANCRYIENGIILEKNMLKTGWLSYTIENLDTRERTILRINPEKNKSLATLQVGEKGRITMSTGAPHADTMGELLVAFIIKEQSEV